jgi:hypothetical protein
LLGEGSSLENCSSIIELTFMKASPFTETKQKVGGEESLTSKSKG